jgi:hypothetical protein
LERLRDAASRAVIRAVEVLPHENALGRHELQVGETKGAEQRLDLDR